jgi:acetate kinase
VNRAVLVLNAGSSSLKFALYEVEPLEVLCRGGVEAIGAKARLRLTGPRASLLEGGVPPESGSHESVVEWLLETLRRRADLEVVAAGHRVVHGGSKFDGPVRVDDAVLTELDGLVPLAPGHQPHNLAAIRAVAKAWPDLPQVACFDTAFHRTQPRLAQLFPIPHELTRDGMVRYGFHGLSYEYIAGVLPEAAGARADGRVIVAHLGHGASLCAMRNRESVATTMGLTVLDGLMMGTRCGAIDPGLVLHLIRERNMAPETVSDILNNRSGLLGVSGISDDVRVLEASDDPRAAEALDLFAYRVVREAGSLIAALGGLDVFVFTAGIGENAVQIRRKICEGLSWAGLILDQARNEGSETCISGSTSAIAALVIPTNEELPIAKACVRIACPDAGS